MRTAIRVTCDPPYARLEVDGELDVVTEPLLEAVLTCLRLREATRVSADLSGVSFIDAHTLSMLYVEQRRLRAAGGDLLVVGASVRYSRTCRLAGYTSLVGRRSPLRTVRLHTVSRHGARVD
jgi:anti-anti-sigma factor